MPLAMANSGETKIITGIRAKDAIKKHLQNMGFVIGEKIEILGDNSNGLILYVKGTRIALNRGLASQIIVE